MSNPTVRAVPPPCSAHRRATTRATPATGRRPNTPSPSSTWSRTLADASTSDAAAASRGPGPIDTAADRMPRSGHGPAPRRSSPAGDCASVSAEMISPS